MISRYCASLFYLVSGQTFPGNDRTTTCAKHEQHRQCVQAYYSSDRGHKAHIPLNTSTRKGNITGYDRFASPVPFA